MARVMGCSDIVQTGVKQTLAKQCLAAGTGIRLTSHTCCQDESPIHFIESHPKKPSIPQDKFN